MQRSYLHVLNKLKYKFDRIGHFVWVFEYRYKGLLSCSPNVNKNLDVRNYEIKQKFKMIYGDVIRKRKIKRKNACIVLSKLQK